MGTGSSRHKEVLDLVVKDDIAGLQRLLDTADTDVNAVDSDGRTALHQAAVHNSQRSVDLLLSHASIDVNAKDKEGQTPLVIAAATGHEAICLRLLDDERCAADYNLCDSRGISALHQGAAHGCLLLVEALLSRGVDIDQRTGKEMTALMMASQNGQSSVAQLLLARGANASAVDAMQSTSLHYACMHGHRDIAEQLIASGAPVDSQDRFQCTPLLYALQSKDKVLEDLLVAHGANLTYALDVNFEALCYHTEGK